ncbi:alpha/beta fold hydrolase [Nesterenkonia sphaerica]|uniref:Alpha/beta hydrolase n=1 Tax=Nesterenkonia sphaerica TaxID=1804988 RepID=A0A5R9API2_9MICC|nr:alpha/beta hydrolase [Nesterenkonia sphaerica]TLP79924.1 alpha/beta hydrolase [Nesterenkonia sphaerica]
MARFQTAGAQLSFEVVGKETDPLFVQLHGLTSSAWREHHAGLDVTGELSGFRVLRYDSRGHGSSTGRPVPDDYLWPQLAEDLLHLLEAVAPGETVHAGGPSMGAATQLCAALEEPHRFASLSLLVPPTVWSTRTEQTDQYLRSAEVVEQHGVETFVRLTGSAPPPPAQAGRTRQLRPAVSPELLPAVLRGASMTDLPAPEDLARLQVPVQILAWTHDAAHPVSSAETLHRLLPGSEFSIAETPHDLATWPSRVASFVGQYRR